MTDPVVDTIGYYDQCAAGFAAQTVSLDLDPVYQRFLRHVRPGGRILDAGCGAGRDALAFAERGYDVVAFDASTVMVQLSREQVGGRVPVHVMQFEDLHWQNEFDGIWTCASLLHVPKTSFVDIAMRLAGALRPAAAWYMSFKLGTGERVANGRLFVDHTAETLHNGLAEVPIDIAGTWISNDVRPNRAGEFWLNAIAVRQ